nr:MAG TPA: hypothetical protein [Caudoviricetes sp.]
MRTKHHSRPLANLLAIVNLLRRLSFWICHFSFFNIFCYVNNSAMVFATHQISVIIKIKFIY